VEFGRRLRTVGRADAAAAEAALGALMRKFGVPLLLALLTSSAWAYHSLVPRPVGNLRFDDTRPSVWPTFAASDGRDFLIAGHTDSDRAPNVYPQQLSLITTQKIAQGVPSGPDHTLTTWGTTVGIAWTGSHYLVAWGDPSGLWVAPFSREGSMLEVPEEPAIKTYQSYGYGFACNGRTALAIAHIGNGLVAQPFDLSGHKASAAATFKAPTNVSLKLGPAASGYVLLGDTSTDNGFISNLWLTLLRDDGTLDHSMPVDTWELSTQETAAAIATDGENTVVLYQGGVFGHRELKSVVLDRDGAIRHAVRTLNVPGAAKWTATLRPRQMVWDGSQFVAVLAASTVQHREFNASLVRIAPDGEAIGDIVDLKTDQDRDPTGLATNGRDLLVACGTSAIIVRLETMSAGKPISLWRQPNYQSRLTLAARKGDYLAAWLEGGKLRASRIDDTGNYLDGDGIVLAESVPDYYWPTAIAIDSDGTNWLVVWADGHIHAMRVSPSGAKLDAAPLTLGEGNGASVKWNGTRYLVIYSNGSLYSTTVGANGDVTPGKLLAAYEHDWSAADVIHEIAYSNPALAVARDEALVVFHRYELTQGPPRPFCDIFGCRGTYRPSTEERDHAALRLDRSGAAIGTPFTIEADRTDYELPHAVATDGTRYLVAWEGAGVWATFIPTGKFQQAGTIFGLDSAGEKPSLAFDGRDYVAMLDHCCGSLRLGRISPGGALDFIDVEKPRNGHFSGGGAVAANAATPALAGVDYARRGEGDDPVSRNAVFFPRDIDGGVTPPSTPIINSASRNEDGTVSVQWFPVAGAFGVSIETQLADGFYRRLGAVTGAASDARIALHGQTITGVRIRAWNAAGDSEPSATITLPEPKRRSVR
jgi:hypothetical protein